MATALRPAWKKALIREILAKTELQRLEQDIIIGKLEKLLGRNGKVVKALNAIDSEKVLLKNRSFKALVKEARAYLRTIYGSFLSPDYKKMDALMEQYVQGPSDELLLRMLSTHRSTKERLPFYGEVYASIFEMTGTPESVLDLGCGLNPLSYGWLGCHPSYQAIDLSKKDMELLERFFSAHNIKGRAEAKDLSLLPELPEADVCFCFKLFDSLETIERNITEKLLVRIAARHAIASFPRMSLGGRKRIQDEKRAWFERILHKQGLHYRTFTIPNEFFYVVTLHAHR